MEYNEIINFWFTELTPEQYFMRSDAVDERINSFSKVHTAVKNGETEHWRESAQGALAEIIVLDQFSRNLFREDAQSFACDEQAFKLAQEAIIKGYDMELSPEQRKFMYMPYMHSESKQVHEKAVILFTALGNQDTLKYEYDHKDIIDQFGRYPHRNQVLGRVNTPEEEKYLAENSRSFF